MLQKLYYLHKGDSLLSNNFCLLFIDLCKHHGMNLHAISRNIVKWGKKQYLRFDGNMGYRLREGIISPLLQTFRPLRKFKIVFRDSSLNPK